MTKFEDGRVVPLGKPKDPATRGMPKTGKPLTGGSKTPRPSPLPPKKDS